MNRRRALIRCVLPPVRPGEEPSCTVLCTGEAFFPIRRLRSRRRGDRVGHLLHTQIAASAHGRLWQILLQKSAIITAKRLTAIFQALVAVCSIGGRLYAVALTPAAVSRRAVASVGGGRATSLARRRRFCAIAASVNSSCAPRGPSSRRRPSLRMRLRCANSISTRFPSEM